MTRMTKAQLVDENTRLRAHTDVLETLLLNSQAEVDRLNRPATERLRPVPLRTPSPAVTPCQGDRSAYWDYVRAAKHAQRGKRVVSYLAFDDWAAHPGARSL